MVIGEADKQVINSTSKFIYTSKKLELNVNEGKNSQPNIDSTRVNNYSFEKADNLKYTRVNII